MSMSEKGTSNTTLFGTSIMLMFVVTASRSKEISEQFTAGLFPLELFYLFLFFILGFQALFYEKDTGILVIDTSQWSPDELAPQLAAGLVIGLGIGAPLALVGHPRVPENFFSEFVTQAVYIVFVETLFLIVVLRTIRFRGLEVGFVLQPGLFAFLHEAVRHPWLSGQFTTESIAFFAYAGIFGALFQALYLAREYLPADKRILGVPARAYFGAITVAVVHLIVNTVLLLVQVRAGQFEMVPLMWWSP
jgi:hypothetical protein